MIATAQKRRMPVRHGILAGLENADALVELVLESLGEHVGPAAEILIEDALLQAGLQVHQLLDSRSFLVFLKALKQQLPPDIDRQTVYDRLWHQALERFEFR